MFVKATGFHLHRADSRPDSATDAAGLIHVARRFGSVCRYRHPGVKK
jgi:hypothetical protein